MKIAESRKQLAKPRLGFLGVGWIGRHRLEAVAKSGLPEIVAVADSSQPLAKQAADLSPKATVIQSLEELLQLDVDGVVIATPSALHAAQAIKALEHDVAVFCQKPLGRTANETAAVIDAARSANLLLGVDLSYRFIEGVQKIRALCHNGDLGEVYAIDLMFHNAYGPDKEWFYEPRLSGGGCVIDLGIHLVDLALWTLGFPAVQHVSSRLFAKGVPIEHRGQQVEDYAVAQMDLENGATIRLACSWKLPAGCDAIISGSFYGTRSGAAFHNVDGSFYEFTAERFHGTKRETLVNSSKPWGGLAVVDWVQRLAHGERFNSDIETLVSVAEALDRIYDNCAEEAMIA